MDGTQARRAETINWASVRAVGELLGHVIFTDITVSDALRWRGPVIDSDSIAGVRRDGALEGVADLELTLAPDLAADDPFVRFLAGLGGVEGLHVMASPSLAGRLGSPRGLTTWTTESDANGRYAARWSEGTRTTMAGLMYAFNFSDDDVRRLYGPRLAPDDDVLEHWRAFQVHMARGAAGRIFVTGRDGILASRWEGGVPGAHGQMTPAEAVHVATLVARGRGQHVVGAEAETGFLEKMDPFLWASATAQALIPAYPQYHGHLITEMERSGGGPLSGQPGRFALEHLEGVYKWLRLLVLSLDRLARAHLRDACIKSGNWTMLGQSDALAAAVQACAGTLEALAGLIAQRSGSVTTAGERRTVSFPSLVSRKKPWATRLGRYDRAGELAAEAADGPIGLATAIREQGFHYHPLGIRSAAFGRLTEVVGPSGPEPRFLEDVTMGAVQPMGEAAGIAWATQGEEGILLQGDDPPYLLPWPYVRAVAGRLAQCLNASLEEMARVEGAGEADQPFVRQRDILLASVGLPRDQSPHAAQ